ncbi:hypothetical protein [Rodentibacter pneumotropicus]|uniref:hypothetical protein n=1 Tax=Rodentibacter pneumotropicus TaxID=758 RepID=UPI001864A1FF|nr:hypothetical protein [Rodentibacter pneumotropicus]
MNYNQLFKFIKETMMQYGLFKTLFGIGLLAIMCRLPETINAIANFVSLLTTIRGQ